MGRRFLTIEIGLREESSGLWFGRDVDLLGGAGCVNERTPAAGTLDIGVGQLLQASVEYAVWVGALFHVCWYNLSPCSRKAKSQEVLPPISTSSAWATTTAST